MHHHSPSTTEFHLRRGVYPVHTGRHPVFPVCTGQAAGLAPPPAEDKKSFLRRFNRYPFDTKYFGAIGIIAPAINHGTAIVIAPSLSHEIFLLNRTKNHHKVVFT